MTTDQFIDRLRQVARDCGYAVGVHGSQTRDLDLMAVAWTPEATDAQTLVDTLCEKLGLKPREANVYDPWHMEPNPEVKPWGRLAWSLDGTPPSVHYLDLSVAPRCGEPLPEFILEGYRQRGARDRARGPEPREDP